MSKRILVVSDCPSLNTGYARVARLIAISLHNAGYTVTYLPCNATEPENKRDLPYRVEPFEAGDRYWNQRIGDFILSYKPSLSIAVGEFVTVGYLGAVCRNFNLQALYYVPVEGLNYPPHFVYYEGGHIDYRLTMAKFHYLVAYSEFGKQQIHKQLPGIVHSTMPHAVDTKIFRPLDKIKCREKFFPNLMADPKMRNNFFVVGAVYRNQRRKGVDYLLKGFKHFVEEYEADVKCYLFLAMDPKDHKGLNINNYVKYLGLSGRVTNVPVVGGKQGPDDHALAEIYNTFDVHCCPFRGEGFGLPQIESLASGCHLVYTDYATPPEYIGNAGHKIPVFDTEPCEATNCEWAVLDYKEVGHALGRIYTGVNTREPNTKGVELAKKYTEEIVGGKWVDLVNSLPLPEMPEVDLETGRRNMDTLIEDYIDALES